MPSSASLPKRKHWSFWRQSWPGLIGGLVLGMLILASVLAHLVSPADPLAMAPDQAFLAPSAAHPFGTDEFGRDLLSRVIYGTRTSVAIATGVVLIAGAIGIPLGLIAGYVGGVIDALIMRLVDVILAFPAILLAVGLVAVLGQGAINGMIAVIIVSIPAFARLVRASTLQHKDLEYVLAARAIGASDGRIMLRAILPNCLPPVLVQAAINAGQAVLLEAALSFLGLGVVPPAPSLGNMLNSARLVLYRAPWYGLFPGVALTLLVLSVNVLADSGQKLLSRGIIR